MGLEKYTTLLLGFLALSAAHASDLTDYNAGTVSASRRKVSADLRDWQDALSSLTPNLKIVCDRANAPFSKPLSEIEEAVQVPELEGPGRISTVMIASMGWIPSHILLTASEKAIYQSLMDRQDPTAVRTDQLRLRIDEQWFKMRIAKRKFEEAEKILLETQSWAGVFGPRCLALQRRERMYRDLIDGGNRIQGFLSQLNTELQKE